LRREDSLQHIIHRWWQDFMTASQKCTYDWHQLFFKRWRLCIHCQISKMIVGI